ncbi:unnamed protein product [Rotaria socialis]|uniref:Purple acid phosphatase n=1 Tax=Rotaria socialis TaxID=392032 RepID=A0A820D1I1_9BILA|nr:unnamed protein product [Rotaria socialis]CAF4223700.1 unnamed protein product [Rotaria socialis]CAF4383545.1 unnamed protein product [Rotaria socialis]CAF4488919.1 unnamed protein product [Rotaria socialis]
MCEGKANTWGPQAFIEPGYMHTILLEDLRPSTTYFYRVGTDEHGWPSIYSFTNRPADENEAVNLIAICYARGIGALWDGFMTQIQSIAVHVPYMVSIGNHEYDYETGGDKDPSGAPGPGGFRPKCGDYGRDSGGECAIPMVRRFHSPSNGNGLFWYSFDVGPIHVIYISTEHDFRRSSIQYLWLEKDLSSVNRSRTPWLIVGSHRHMYTSAFDSARETRMRLMVQLYLESLFYRYHVDLNLFAHRHSYERSCPMFQGKCIEDGITHVLISMAGQSLDSDIYILSCCME